MSDPTTDSSVSPVSPVRSDSARQSLADALGTSFRILKMAMVVLVVLFLASGTFVVEQNEKAIVLRLGKNTGDVKEAGFHWAFPAPIDEVVRIPVEQSSTVAIGSHWLYLRANEKGLTLNQLRRGGEGLKPMRDGSLLTADRGLVHAQWRVTYSIDDLIHYVSLVSDSDVEKAETIITKILENAAIHVVAGYTTEDVTRKRLGELRAEVKIAINDTLESLNTGIIAESVEIPSAIPPVQTKIAFDRVVREENRKRTTIRQAEQHAREMLNATAGASHDKLIRLLDEVDAATAAGDSETAARIGAEVDRVVLEEATGDVGGMIRSARGYDTRVVQQMNADLEQYQTLVGEYRARPELLKARLWEDVKGRLFRNPKITKIHRPSGTEFRIKVGIDPRQRQRQERDEILREIQDGPPQRLELKTPGGPLTVP
jgi:modulator of FtsH protease HflK